MGDTSKSLHYQSAFLCPEAMCTCVSLGVYVCVGARVWVGVACVNNGCHATSGLFHVTASLAQHDKFVLWILVKLNLKQSQPLTAHQLSIYLDQLFFFYIYIKEVEEMKQKLYSACTHCIWHWIIPSTKFSSLNLKR